MTLLSPEQSCPNPHSVAKSLCDEIIGNAYLEQMNFVIKVDAIL